MNSTFFKSVLTLILIFVGLSSFAYAQDNGQQMKPEDTEWYEPVPPKVIPGNDHFISAPSDAEILFDGTDLSKWESVDGSEAKWIVEDGHMTVKTRSGDIQTKESFGSVQLYIEWRSPLNMDHKGQDRGNSGIFLQNTYELQVLDAWENQTYVNGMAGSIYKQTPPLVNPAKEPSEWQSYNIAFTAPVFGEDGELESPARITVMWNGVVVQNNTEILGDTPYIGLPKYSPHGKLPLRLQDHNSEVSYRNIWIRNLSPAKAPIKKLMD